MMRLFTSDNAELMDVQALRIENGNLVVVGTIMGALPTEAVLTPEELRKSFRLLNLHVITTLIAMLFRKSKVSNDAATFGPP